MTDARQSARTGSSPDAVSAAQQRAVQAYMNIVLPAESADPAGRDALDAYRQTLAQRSGVDPDSPAAVETLLALTRLMAAVSVPDASEPADRRQAVWASIGAGAHVTCRESASLLATRANGNIAAAESAALDAHLAGCAHCRDLAERTRAGTVAFGRALNPPGRPGGGLGAIPRAAYTLLALLVAAVVAVTAVLSGGSTHPGSAAAGPVPVTTAQVAPSATTLAVGAPVAATRARPGSRSHRGGRRGHRSHPGSHPRARHRGGRAHRRTGAHGHTPGAHHARSGTTATSSATSPPPVSEPAVPVTPTPAAPVSPAAPDPAPAAAASSSGAGASAATGSSGAATGSGGSSALPAESAPQQGIGSLSSGH